MQKVITVPDNKHAAHAEKFINANGGKVLARRPDHDGRISIHFEHPQVIFDVPSLDSGVPYPFASTFPPP